MAARGRSLNLGGSRQLHQFHDPESGLRAVVALDDLRLGPALGGCRALRYESFSQARSDAMRLAEGMTRKAAIARIPHGGGKSVIMLPEGRYDRTELLLAFGEAVDKLQGRYITAEDSGTSVSDMAIVARRTAHVTGLSRDAGGHGDPSPFTALGVLRGIEAVVRLALGRETLEGIHVAMQGVGHVGEHLAAMLLARGAKVTATDIDAGRLAFLRDRPGIACVESAAIFQVNCDVFAPCALGGALNENTVPMLRCKAVAGAANNQLATERDGEQLFARGILYVPDYVINAGGLIAVAGELSRADEAHVTARVRDIYETVYALCERALSTGVRPELLAEELAAQRVAEACAATNA